jgi:hypothetical protein
VVTSSADTRGRLLTSTELLKPTAACEATQPLYWAFGETVWALPSALSGYDLPDPDWDYGTDDGLTEVAGG